MINERQNINSFQKIGFIIFVSIFSFVCFTPSVLAGDYYWLGTADTDLENVSNYDTIPTLSDSLTIDPDLDYYPSSGISYTSAVYHYGGEITGGTWYSSDFQVLDMVAGINGGIYYTPISLFSSISSGIFYETVTVDMSGGIGGGTFYGFVDNEGIIDDGIFCQSEAETGGSVFGGTFDYEHEDCYNYVSPEEPVATSTVSTTTDSYINSVNFGLAVIITMLSIIFIGFIFNSINQKPK